MYPQMYMRSVLRSSEGTLDAADGVFASPDGDAVPKDVGLARFYRLRSLRCWAVLRLSSEVREQRDLAEVAALRPTTNCAASCARTQ